MGGTTEAEGSVKICLQKPASEQRLTALFESFYDSSTWRNKLGKVSFDGMCGGEEALGFEQKNGLLGVRAFDCFGNGLFQAVSVRSL